MLLDATTDPAPPGLDGTAAQVRAERRTVLVASLVGTTVEWYDFFLYATAATIVFNHAFFPVAKLDVWARCWRSRRSPSASSCARSAASCSAISATGSDANAAWP